MVSVGKRLVLDQFFFAPAFIPAFMSCLLVLEGNARDLPNRLQASWGPTVVSNWGLWVPAQILNFRFIPITYQVCGAMRHRADACTTIAYVVACWLGSVTTAHCIRLSDLCCRFFSPTA
jgi:hypothetical protein